LLVLLFIAKLYCWWETSIVRCISNLSAARKWFDGTYHVSLLSRAFWKYR